MQPLVVALHGCPRCAAGLHSLAPVARRRPVLQLGHAAAVPVYSHHDQQHQQQQQQRRQRPASCHHHQHQQHEASAPWQQQQQQQPAPRPSVRARALALSPPPPAGGSPEPRGGSALTDDPAAAAGLRRPAASPPPLPLPQPAEAKAEAAAAAPRSGSSSGGSSSSGSSSPTSEDLDALGWNPTFHERFELGPEIGRGSFGTVFAATHRATGVVYAAKRLPKPSSSSSSSSSVSSSSSNGNGAASASPAASPSRPGSASGDGASAAAANNGNGNNGGSPRASPPACARLAAIEREAACWAAVQGSAYAARLEGLFEDADSAYLVGELVGDGTTLKAALAAAGGRLPEADAAAVARCVLDVLCEAHRRGLAFGDVKPANCVLANQAPPASGDPQALTVRLVDYGSARPVPLTKPCGSPLYMAPEMQQRRFGAAVDVWAAGVMLYQMLTGRLPFWPDVTLEGAAALPPYQIVAAVRNNAVQYPKDAWRGVSFSARALVEAMLERDPAARLTAAEALAHPWFAAALGYAPAPTGAAAAAAAAGGGAARGGNVAEFSDRIAALHL